MQQSETQCVNRFEEVCTCYLDFQVSSLLWDCLGALIPDRSGYCGILMPPSGWWQRLWIYHRSGRSDWYRQHLHNREVAVTFTQTCVVHVSQVIAVDLHSRCWYRPAGGFSVQYLEDVQFAARAVIADTFRYIQFDIAGFRVILEFEYLHITVGFRAWRESTGIQFSLSIL